MPRVFNTAGPNREAQHYTLPPLARLPPDTRDLIDQGFYFVLHGPRQSGKTTSMLALTELLRQDGRYAVVFASIEPARGRADLVDTQKTVIACLHAGAQMSLPPAEQAPDPQQFAQSQLPVADFLRAWTQACPRPLVLVIDEIDCLENEHLMAVLSQLRAGYPNRPAHFPHSIALFGMRDVRDYKVASGGSPNLGTASPFNIKRESLTVRYFDRHEIVELYGQHTAATGQAFTPQAVDRAWELTKGQPYLVNALADLVVRKLHWQGPIDAAQIQEAKERLILERGTHFDSLMARLRDDRVRRVLQPILLGTLHVDWQDDDLSYCQDLGLVDSSQPPQVANPIYREVIVRSLTRRMQTSIPSPRDRWTLADGRLDIDALRTAFVDFWREHAEAFVRHEDYKEVAGQLVLMAFLQRIVNGGGQIHREYAAGLGRIDVLIRWPLDGLVYGDRLENHLFELKVWRQDKADPLAQALQQVQDYAQKVGLASATAVIFDRRDASLQRKWGERLSVETDRPGVAGVPVLVVRV